MLRFDVHKLTVNDLKLLSVLSCDVYFSIVEIKEKFFSMFKEDLDEKTRGRLRTFEVNGLVRVRGIPGKHSKEYRRVRREDVNHYLSVCSYKIESR